MSSAPAPPAESLLAKRRGAAEARRRAEDRARARAEARQRDSPSAALYGPATGRALKGPLLTGREVVVASRERPYDATGRDRFALAVWLRNNGIKPAAVRKVCLYVSTVENLMRWSQRPGVDIKSRCDREELDPVVQRTFLAAVEEAREALAAGRVPAGAEPIVKWWTGASRYEGGRGAAPAGLWTSRLPDDALRCVCDHLAPTRPDFEAEEVIEESQEYCDDVVPDSIDDLRRLNAEGLDELASTLDEYNSRLVSVIGMENGHTQVAKGLKLVCGRWRHALKKNVFELNARLEEYSDHSEMLKEEAERARRIRIEVHGDPREYEER